MRTAVGRYVINTGHTQKNGAVSKVNKKFICHLTRAQHTPSAAATVQVSHLVIIILQCVHPGSHDTHPHGNQTGHLKTEHTEILLLLQRHL
jgi:hypothetical protein